MKPPGPWQAGKEERARVITTLGRFQLTAHFTSEAWLVLCLRSCKLSEDFHGGSFNLLYSVFQNGKHICINVCTTHTHSLRNVWKVVAYVLTREG